MGQFGKTLGERMLEEHIKAARRKRVVIYVLVILSVCALAKYLLT